MISRLATAIMLAWLAPGLAVADRPGVQVSFDGNRIEISLDVVLEAPEASLNEVIHDYDHLDRVFPLVVSSQLLVVHSGGVRRVRADMEGCVLVFCRRLRHVLDVRWPDQGWSSAVSVPVLSDVRAGHFSWRTDALDDGRTRFRFSGWVEPDVWVPPLIGPPAVRRTVRRSFADAMPRLERAAREHARGSP